MEQHRFRFLSSDLTTQEIENAPGNVRDLFDDTFRPETLLEVTDEMDDLAAAYLRQGVVPPR